MGTYVNLMPGMVQRRMAEMEKKNAELVTAEAEAAGALEGTPDLADQGLPIASTGGKASSPAPGTSEAMTASEVSVMAASVLKPAVLDFSADLGPAASPSTPSSTSTEVKLAAASPSTPSSTSTEVKLAAASPSTLSSTSTEVKLAAASPSTPSSTSTEVKLAAASPSTLSSTSTEVKLAAASPSTPSSTSTEVKLAAASPSTPASEPLVPSSLSQAVTGVGLTRLTSGPILELSPVRHDQSTVTAVPSAAPSGPHLSR
nr:uncharacterized serine-rich protein C215.13-like isoform X2 [Oncorhynchus nerka]